MKWRYIAASVAGTSHVAQGLPCQDSCVAALAGEALLLVASDGAGSAMFSHEGSQITCATFLEEVTTHFREGGSVATVDALLIDQWFNAAVQRLHQQAAARESTVREFACTLVFALADGNGSVFVQLGDGGIVASRGGGYVPMTWPDGGEYANTTFFLSDDRALDRLQILIHQPPVEEIALFSDGLQMLALQFATRRAHEPFFQPMFARLRAEPPGESLLLTQLLTEYLASAAINRRTDDDKTLMLATVHSPESDKSPRAISDSADSAGVHQAAPPDEAQPMDPPNVEEA